MGLGPGEIVLILVIAYVVVGPEDMTKLARMTAKGLRELRKLRADLQSEVEEGIPLQSLASEMRESGPLRPLRAEVEKSSTPPDKKTESGTSLNAFRKETAEDLESVMNEIRIAEQQITACTGQQSNT